MRIATIADSSAFAIVRGAVASFRALERANQLAASNDMPGHRFQNGFPIGAWWHVQQGVERKDLKVVVVRWIAFGWPRSHVPDLSA